MDDEPDAGASSDSFGDFVFRSPSMRRLVENIQTVARLQSTVVIEGETGTGKELVARAIHSMSQRKGGYVAFNAAAIPESLAESELFGHSRGAFTGAVGPRIGRFEMAQGGTLFIDEVSSMSLGLQAKFLRAIQEREIDRIGESRPIKLDVRVVTATNVDLFDLVRSGQFRDDLYYRLNVVCIKIPPLRSRPEDIRLLAEKFLVESCTRNGLPGCRLSDQAFDVLARHTWPGNIRELQNVIESAVALSGPLAELRPEHLPDDFQLRVRVRPAHHSSPATEINRPASDSASALFDRMVTVKESFWDVVHRPFSMHDMTRAQVRQIVALGLAEANGNYKKLTGLFGMAPADYKPFMRFLKKHECDVPFQSFRRTSSTSSRKEQTS